MKTNNTSTDDLKLTGVTPGLFYVHAVKLLTDSSTSYSTVIATVSQKSDDNNWNFQSQFSIDLFPLFEQHAVRPINFRSKDLKGMFIEIFDSKTMRGADELQVLWTAYDINEIQEIEEREELDQLLYDSLLEDQSLLETISTTTDIEDEQLVFDEESSQ